MDKASVDYTILQECLFFQNTVNYYYQKSKNKTISIQPLNKALHIILL